MVNAPEISLDAMYGALDDYKEEFQDVLRQEVEAQVRETAGTFRREQAHSAQRLATAQNEAQHNAMEARRAMVEAESAKFDADTAAREFALFQINRMAEDAQISQITIRLQNEVHQANIHHDTERRRLLLEGVARKGSGGTCQRDAPANAESTRCHRG